MTWSLDPLIEIRGCTFGAISERDCRLSAFGTTFVGRGKKRPAIILMIENDKILGWDMAGQPIDPADIERRYPGALDRIFDAQ